MPSRFPLLLVTAAAVAYLAQSAPVQLLRDHPTVVYLSHNGEYPDQLYGRQVPVDFIINQSLSIPIAILQSLQVYLSNITKPASQNSYVPPSN